MKKVLNFLFPSKERETVLNEKAEAILNDLFTLGFNPAEVAIIVERVKCQTTDKIEDQKKHFISKLKEINEAQTILKKV